MITNELKKHLVNQILNQCGDCTIYLFGSYAYGTPDIQSDLDIAVIMDRVESKIQQASELWNALKDTEIPKDIVVASRAEFEFYRHQAGSVFKTISDKGVVLHE